MLYPECEHAASDSLLTAIVGLPEVLNWKRQLQIGLHVYLTDSEVRAFICTIRTIVAFLKFRFLLIENDACKAIPCGSVEDHYVTGY